MAKGSPGDEFPKQKPRGVWSGDAAPGQIALTVYDSAGVRLVRIEVDEEHYCEALVAWLEGWLERVDPIDTPVLAIVR